MRYLVRARIKPGSERSLLEAIENQTLGRGSVAEGEYLRNMREARLCPDHPETLRSRQTLKSVIGEQDDHS